MLYLDESGSTARLYAAGELGLKVIGNGAVELYYDNAKKFETTSGGAKVTGTLEVTEDFVTTMASGYDFWIDRSGNKIRAGDNIKFECGNSGDLQIYHDGTNRIRNVNSTLFIEGDPSYYIGIRPQIGENSAKFLPNGAVELYYDDSKKLETNSGGVNITGALSVNGSPISSAPTIEITAQGSISDASAVIVNSSGNIEAMSGSNASIGSSSDWENTGTTYMTSCKLNTNLAVVCYQDGNNNAAGTAFAVTCNSETTLTKGTNAIFLSDSSAFEISVCRISNTTFCVFCLLYTSPSPRDRG